VGGGLLRQKKEKKVILIDKTKVGKALPLRCVIEERKPQLNRGWSLKSQKKLNIFSLYDEFLFLFIQLKWISFV